MASGGTFLTFLTFFFLGGVHHEKKGGGGQGCRCCVYTECTWKGGKNKKVCADVQSEEREDDNYEEKEERKGIILEIGSGRDNMSVDRS